MGTVMPVCEISYDLVEAAAVAVGVGAGCALVFLALAASVVFVSWQVWRLVRRGRGHV